MNSEVLGSLDLNFSLKPSSFAEERNYLTPEGNESKPVTKNQFVGRTIAVFTSGGDAQGMNAAVRAVVRMGIHLGCTVYLIHEGYQGMIDGLFKLATWASVSGTIGTGGTIIGSARCKEFTERSGRLKAARNLIRFGINNLVCIGGDGTLTGANLFRIEWISLIQELVDKNEITYDERNNYSLLNIVGVVASIDNDFCGTYMTIGANTALHRIIEAIDAISTTALSHQRCFVMEVMGRHCGYLALAAGIAAEADWVLIPEDPQKPNWEDVLCRSIHNHREAGHRLNIIILSEGATDSTGKHITGDYIKEVITTRLNIDTRVTILGHVQRGGITSAYDRILASRLGAEAVLALMHAKPEQPPCIMATTGNIMYYIPLLESVFKTQMVGNAMDAKDFKRVMELRGLSFRNNFITYMQMSKFEMKKAAANLSQASTVFAIINIGAPASGINSCIRSLVRHGNLRGCRMLAVYDGFEGLISDQVKELDWKSVYGWTRIGGSMIGCQRVDAQSVGFNAIAKKLDKYNISGLFIIGGFEAFTSVLQLQSMRETFKEFRIPLVCIPATISNNVPGSDFSIGCDTSINEIVTICDKIRQSAMGSRRRVFLIETMGAYCGYLAQMAGMAAGADHSFIFEEAFTISDLIDNISHLKNKMEGDLKIGILIRNEMANKHYTTDFMHNLMQEMGKGLFSARVNVIGHMQQGGQPTPIDRNMAIKFALRAFNYMYEKASLSKTSEHLFHHEKGAVVVGISGNRMVFTNVTDLKEFTDFEHRIPLNQWWMKLRPLYRILSKHEAVYISDTTSAKHVFFEDHEENEDLESDFSYLNSRFSID